MRVFDIASCFFNSGILMGAFPVITLGDKPDQIAIPVTHLIDGQKYLAFAKALLVDGQLVLQATREVDENLDETHCIIKMKSLIAEKDTDILSYFEPDSGIEILASQFERRIGSTGRFHLLCKVPIGKVIVQRYGDRMEQFLITQDFRVMKNDEIESPVSPDVLVSLTQAIDEGRSTPA